MKYLMKWWNKRTIDVISSVLSIKNWNVHIHKGTQCPHSQRYPMHFYLMNNEENIVVFGVRYFQKGIFPRATSQVTISQVSTSQMCNFPCGNFPNEISQMTISQVETSPWKKLHFPHEGSIKWKFSFKRISLFCF